jgi:hypothetical protein
LLMFSLGDQYELCVFYIVHCEVSSWVAGRHTHTLATCDSTTPYISFRSKVRISTQCLWSDILKCSCQYVCSRPRGLWCTTTCYMTISLGSVCRSPTSRSLILVLVESRRSPPSLYLDGYMTINPSFAQTIVVSSIAHNHKCS